MRVLAAVLLAASSAIGRASLAQCQVQKLVASDAQGGDYFAQQISASGDWLIVSAFLDADLGLESGSAYLFQRQGSAWVESQNIHASDGGPGDRFGCAVAIAGDVAVVGALLDSPTGILTAGSAYVFERSGTSWIETAKLFANDASVEDRFGVAVAVSGTRVVIGAADDDPAGAGSGSAYVFEKLGGVWSQTAKLTASDAAAGDAFGFEVAVAGDRIVVGAIADEGAGGQTDTGSAYVFELELGSWVEKQKLVPNDPADQQIFGAAASLSGSTILIGAAQDDTAGSGAGSVYVFEHQGAAWVQTQELTASDSNPGNQFGAFMTHAGDVAIIGALGDGDTSSTCGSAYEFRRTGSTWIQAGKMLAADGAQGGLLGSSVALAGTTALSGAPRTDDACPGVPSCNSGSVYVFELAPTAVQYGPCDPVSACGNVDDHGGCDIAGGDGAVLAACGSGSVSADDLRLELTNSRPNKLTLLFMGPAQSQVIYGNGVRVAAPQNPTLIYRFGGAAADAQGRVLRGPGLVAYSQGFPPLGRIQSGQTWNFQFWFRDPGGWCGANTNFSNGVRVAFVP